MPVFGVLPPIYKKDVILNMEYEYYPKVIGGLLSEVC